MIVVADTGPLLALAKVWSRLSSIFAFEGCYELPERYPAEIVGLKKVGNGTND